MLSMGPEKLFTELEKFHQTELWNDGSVRTEPSWAQNITLQGQSAICLILQL